MTNKILGDRVERAPLNEPVVALTLEYADIDDTRARTADTKKTVGSNQQRRSDIWFPDSIAANCQLLNRAQNITSSRNAITKAVAQSALPFDPFAYAEK